MVARYTALATAAILAFVLFELNSLLRGTVEGPPWQFVIVAALVLGSGITWTGLTYRLRTWVVALLNLGAFAVVALRIATPDTLLVILPTPASLTEIGRQFDQAMVIIRNGIEPVIPVSGLVVIIAGVMWAVGALAAYGLMRSRPVFAVVPGLVLALQFATMDRSPTELLRIVVFVLLLAGTALAVTADERRNGPGTMAARSGRSTRSSIVGPAAAAAVTVAVLGSVLSVSALANTVPYDGMMQWRASTGLTGEFYGGVSYNPFVGIQQSLVTQTDVPLFFAQVEGDLEPEDVYFRLLTMDTYQGGQFFADDPDVEPIENDAWEAAESAFTGPTADITTTIVIDRLVMDWLPAAYTPTGVEGDDSFTSAVRIRQDDGSIILDGGITYPDLLYAVTSEVPLPDVDLLATGSDGALSPLFAAAAADDAPVPEPVALDGDIDVRETPPDVERYLQLPETLDTGIAALAREKTANLDTPFEMGMALEQWFRSSDFQYTTDITPGHGATDLAEWLLDEYADTPFHRAGYCENFATSMAVMARTLDIPSRVVLGFTPGEATTGDNVVVVRDRNAHAWVELWMPTQGWVRFDPTPRPDRINPATTGDVAEELGFDPVAYFSDIPDPVFNQPDRPPSDFDPGAIPDDQLEFDPSRLIGVGTGGGFSLPGWLQPVVATALLAALLLGLLPVLKLWRRRRRMARLERGDITAAWEEIVAQLDDYGRQPDPTLTPDEMAAGVDPALAPLASVYGRSLYGPETPSSQKMVATATRSLEQTTQRLSSRYSRWERLAAWYRPTSLIPSRFRRTRRS